MDARCVCRILIPPFPGSNPGAPANDQVIDIAVL
jgi:hypothetical protein